MSDAKKTKKQLIEEITALRARVAELENSAQLFAASLDEYQRKARELEGLYHISVTTAHELEPERLLDRLYREVNTLLSPDTFVVVGYSAQRNEVSVLLAMEDGQPIPGANEICLSLEECGLTGWLIKHSQSLLVGDLLSDPLPARPRHETTAARSWLGVPLVVGDYPIGAVSVQSFTPNLFTEEDRRFLELASSPIAIALQNAQLFRDARHRAEELEILRKVSLRLTSSLELHGVLEAVLEAAMRLLESVEAAHIFLYDDEKLTFGAALEPDGFKDRPYSEPRPNGLTYTVARKGETIVVDDFRTHPLFEEAPHVWKGSIVGIPLKLGPRVVGVMNVAWSTPYAARGRELHLLSLLADHAAIAIENARLHDLVAQQARTDALTGLPNRRALDERLAAEVRRAGRYGHHFALLMMDLDGFKVVNDTFGHPIGDRVLSKIARLLDSATRRSDFIARYGGDEFALLLPEAELPCAIEVAEKVSELIESASHDIPELGGHPLSLSIGIAIYPDDASSAQDLLECADRVLYHIKRTNPGTFATSEALLA